MREAIEGSRFGVDLVNPVDHYRMAERRGKHAGLSILSTFATVWLIEVLTGVRVDPIQYLMLGGALCRFYLLELSLSEHLGLPAACAIASIAVIGRVVAYGRVAVHRFARALVVGGGVVLLYSHLYPLPRDEDYALLISPVGLAKEGHLRPSPLLVAPVRPAGRFPKQGWQRSEASTRRAGRTERRSRPVKSRHRTPA